MVVFFFFLFFFFFFVFLLLFFCLFDFQHLNLKVLKIFFFCAVLFLSFLCFYFSHKNIAFALGLSFYVFWSWPYGLYLCRMAIQVDKFDFESLPMPSHDALRQSSLYQQEEERQQAHGGQINSTLDLRWNIISFSCQLLYSI